MKKLLPFALILLALVNVSYSETVTLRIDSYSAQSQTDPNHKHKIVIPEISPWDSGSLRFEGTDILALEVGEQYTVRYEAPNSMAGPYSGNIGIVHFEVPAGYKVMVDGYDTSIFYPHGDFIAYQDTDIATLEIVPVMNLDAGATTDPVLISDEFEMYFGVGKLADGSYISPAKISAVVQHFVCKYETGADQTSLNCLWAARQIGD